MKVCDLKPQPMHSEPFQLRRSKYVPEQPGCYALTTFDDDILYIGRSVNLRQRMQQHLEDKEKTEMTEFGKALTFHWLGGLEFPEQIEIAWINLHESVEGHKPVMNKISPSYPSVSG